MIRRGLGLGGILFAALAFASSASAAAPEGPRLAFIRFDAKPQRLELISADPGAGALQSLAGGSLKDRPLPIPGAPGWSSDGGSLAFAAFKGKGPDGKAIEQIFIVSADGSGLVAVPGTRGAVDPVFSPDGHSLAFARLRERRRKNRHGEESIVYRSASIWLAPLSGGPQRQLTPWRNGLISEPTSFSGDGTELLTTRQKSEGSPPEVVALGLAGGATVLAREAADGVYSPDGSRVAYLLVSEVARHHNSRGGKPATASLESTTDLYTMNADGSSPERLTDTPRAVEEGPSWDPSGQRLVVTQVRGGSESALLGFGDAIIQMNADGSCASNVLSIPGVALYGASWQPGPGRGAGPISC